MNELVTVIVPVYKVEPYLKKCIESIINQTYYNLEIILVDDGSPDRCGEICDEYAEIDNRICVIHKENGGLSDARNAGLDLMTGAYVTFVDSDDYISRYYVEKLYDALQNHKADIAICAEEYVEESTNGCNKILKRPYRELNGIKVMSSEVALSYSLRQDLYEASAWAKLYKSELFCGVKYPLGFAYEDQGTTYKTFLKSKRIVYFGERLYFYLQRGGSILHTSGSSKRFWDGIKMVEMQCEDIIKQLPQLENAANSRLISMYFHALMGAELVNDYVLLEYAWKMIKRLRRNVVFNGYARFKARIASIISYLGMDMFLLINKSVIK